MRKLGLSCDNVQSFELVTADGKVRKVSATENPDLYWALRGGGGNFGVVSGFEYRLHPLAHPILAGGRMYPFSQARAVVKGLADMAANAPDELYLTGSIVNASGEGKLPKGTYVAVEFVYSDDPKVGERFLPTLDKLGKPLNDTIVAKPYVVAQNAPRVRHPALPPGLGVYAIRARASFPTNSSTSGFMPSSKGRRGSMRLASVRSEARLPASRRTPPPTGIARHNTSSSSTVPGTTIHRTSTTLLSCGTSGRSSSLSRRATT
jgi:hypothetical protein